MSDLLEILRRVASGDLSPDQAQGELKKKRGRPKLDASTRRKRAYDPAMRIGAEFQRRIEENATKRRPKAQRAILREVARYFNVSETRASAHLKNYRDSVLDVLSIQPSFGLDNPPREYAGVAKWGKTRNPSKSARSTIPKK